MLTSTACSVTGHHHSVTRVKVYDPAMANPIPHAFVFIPTDPMGKIPAITPGAKTCGTCDLPLGGYVVATTTDATGSFSLSGVPTGTQIPVVVQIGKWRREVFVNTTACQDTALLAPCLLSPLACGQPRSSRATMPGHGPLTGAADNPRVTPRAVRDRRTDAGANNPPSPDATVGIDATGAGADAQVAFIVDGAAQVDAGCPGPDLRCHVAACSGQGTTSVSGKVYDPAMANPIPHAFVFVPTDPMGKLPVITAGAKTCDTCGLSLGSYVAATMSDATGSFSLSGVPTGTQIPVVVQIGKWRREVFVATTACQDTALGPAFTHLPATQAEGDMPAMALLTGGADNLGCLLAQFGIGRGEFSSPHAGGRLDVYQGLGGSAGLGLGGGAPGLSSGTAGDCTSTSCPLWSGKQSLESYDIVLLSCEGSTYDQPIDAGGIATGINVTPVGKQAMHDWLGEGGKVFATHFQYTWFENSPAADFQGIATWLGSSSGNEQGSFIVETSFPKAQDFRTDLVDAGAMVADGGLALTGVGTSVSSVNPPALAWIEDPSSQDTKYFTFTTPVGGSTCGKAAFSDLHAGGMPQGDIPGSCTSGPLDSQQKAMELLFFDLSACVSDDSKAAPGPPPSGMTLKHEAERSSVRPRAATAARPGRDGPLVARRALARLRAAAYRGARETLAG